MRQGQQGKSVMDTNKRLDPNAMAVLRFKPGMPAPRIPTFNVMVRNHVEKSDANDHFPHTPAIGPMTFAAFTGKFVDLGAVASVLHDRISKVFERRGFIGGNKFHIVNSGSELSFVEKATEYDIKSLDYKINVIDTDQSGNLNGRQMYTASDFELEEVRRASFILHKLASISSRYQLDNTATLSETFQLYHELDRAITVAKKSGPISRSYPYSISAGADNNVIKFHSTCDRVRKKLFASAALFVTYGLDAGSIVGRLEDLAAIYDIFPHHFEKDPRETLVESNPSDYEGLIDKQFIDTHSGDHESRMKEYMERLNSWRVSTFGEDQINGVAKRSNFDASYVNVFFDRRKEGAALAQQSLKLMLDGANIQCTFADTATDLVVSLPAESAEEAQQLTRTWAENSTYVARRVSLALSFHNAAANNDSPVVGSAEDEQED